MGRYEPIQIIFTKECPKLLRIYSTLTFLAASVTSVDGSTLTARCPELEPRS